MDGKDDEPDTRYHEIGERLGAMRPHLQSEDDPQVKERNGA